MFCPYVDGSLFYHKPVFYLQYITYRSLLYMLKHFNLFCDLPDNFYDSAFLDLYTRLGSRYCGEMFSSNEPWACGGLFSSNPA